MSRRVNSKAVKKSAKKPTKKVRVLDPVGTRASLIDAAQSLFAEEGLDVSLDAICERAGFTRGAFYVHFKTREDLTAAVIDRVMSGFLDSIVGASFDLETVVRGFAMAVEHGLFPLPGRVRPHQIIDACMRSEALRITQLEIIDRAVTRLSEVIVRDPRVRKDLDARSVSMLLLAIVMGAEIAVDLRAPFDATEVAESLLKMLKA
jgi:TetR/AcrR family transcriptional regulator, transcriptional repressor for nem operon